MTQLLRERPGRIVVDDPEILEDPYPTYAALREAGPLCRTSLGSWAVTRHEEVSKLMRDPHLAVEFPEIPRQLSVGDDDVNAWRRKIVLQRDPPHHGPLRSALTHAYNTVLPAALEVDFAPLADALLEEGRHRGTFDAIDGFALPLATNALCALTGIPAEMRDEMLRRSSDLAAAFGPIERFDDKTRERARAAFHWYRSGVADLFAERRQRPIGDFVSMLTEETGTLEDDELIANVVFITFTGLKATTALIGNGIAALATYPDQLAKLRSDAELIPVAVEEFLRYDSPMQVSTRRVTTPFEIGGRELRPGRFLSLLIGSANRDERRFKDPENLDVTRTPNQHTSWGSGIHHCFGMAFARAQARLAFERFLPAIANFEISGPSTRTNEFYFRSFVHLPVEVA